MLGVKRRREGEESGKGNGELGGEGRRNEHEEARLSSEKKNDATRRKSARSSRFVSSLSLSLSTLEKKSGTYVHHPHNHASLLQIKAQKSPDLTKVRTNHVHGQLSFVRFVSISFGFSPIDSQTYHILSRLTPMMTVHPSTLLFRPERDGSSLRGEQDEFRAGGGEGVCFGAVQWNGFEFDWNERDEKRERER